MNAVRARYNLVAGISVVAFSVVGCASPQVQYTKIDVADSQGMSKFRFAESVIKFDYVKDNYGALTGQVSITSVPQPSGKIKYGVVGTGALQNYGTATTINATYRGDTDLIQEIGVSVSDKTVQAIQTLGAIATAAGAFFAANPPPPTDKPKLPEGISISTFLDNIPSSCTSGAAGAKPDRDGDLTCSNLSLEGTTDYIADINISARPIDAFALTTVNFPYTSNSLLYSACRSANITLKKSADKSVAASITVAVADPKWIETLALPPKGKVTVQPSCGANSTAEDANLPTALDYINALMTQASAVKSSLDKKATSGAK